MMFCKAKEEETKKNMKIELKNKFQRMIFVLFL